MLKYLAILKNDGIPLLTDIVDESGYRFYTRSGFSRFWRYGLLAYLITVLTVLVILQ